MKKIVSFLGVIFFVIVSINAQSLKIMSYNLRFGELATLQQLGEYIKSNEPDIVLLQEVDVFTKRERAVHQNGKNFIAELGYYTNMMSLFGKSINYKGGYYGLGILTRFPVISSEKFYLPLVENGREQRSLLVARIELENGRKIAIACTHLDLKPSIRQVQVDSINHILSTENYPVILAGDFNAKPDSHEINSGMKKWKSLGKDNDYTIPSKNPTSKIDYIFCYPANVFEEKSFTVLQSALSDHCPILAEIYLKENK